MRKMSPRQNEVPNIPLHRMKRWSKLHSSPRRYPHPTPWKLWMLPYMILKKKRKCCCVECLRFSFQCFPLGLLRLRLLILSIKYKLPVHKSMQNLVFLFWQHFLYAGDATWRGPQRRVRLRLWALWRPDRVSQPIAFATSIDPSWAISSIFLLWLSSICSYLLDFCL